MKTLYILTSDGGDGSRGVHFTFDKDFIDLLQKKYDNDELDYDSLGVDGDGFGYATLTVPDDFTLQNHSDAAVDYADMLEEDDENAED